MCPTKNQDHNPFYSTESSHSKFFKEEFMSLNPKGCHCYKLGNLKLELSFSSLECSVISMLPLCCIFHQFSFTFITQVLPKELDSFEITPRQTSLISQVTGGLQGNFPIMCRTRSDTGIILHHARKEQLVAYLPSCAVRRPLSAQIPQSLSVAGFFRHLDILSLHPEAIGSSWICNLWPFRDFCLQCSLKIWKHWEEKQQSQ